MLDIRRRNRLNLSYMAENEDPEYEESKEGEEEDERRRRRETESTQIGGTVIQRSFVSTDVPNVIHIASIPIQELGMEDASLEAILTEILGIPYHTALTAEQFADFVAIVRDIGPQSTPPYAQLIDRAIGEGPRWFARGCFSLLASPSAGESLMPLLAPMSLLNSEFKQRVRLPSEALHTALVCLASHAARPPEADSFFEDVLRYDIPLGHSPNVKSDSLSLLLKTAQHACIAPLAAGGGIGVQQLGQGHYVTALLTTGTGGVMTLILIGTVAVGSLLLDKIVKNRRRH